MPPDTQNERMDNPVHKLYGNRTRIRVCGICIENNAILLARHRLGPAGVFWSPPGGGLEFGEDCESCLQREFQEETGLTIRVGALLFTTELVQPPLHAVELFFDVQIVGGQLALGVDPESGENQLLEEVRFLTQSELAELPPSQLHGILLRCPKIEQIPCLKGYFKL